MRTLLINHKFPSFDEVMELAQNNPDHFSKLILYICEKMTFSTSAVGQERGFVYSQVVLNAWLTPVKF